MAVNENFREEIIEAVTQKLDILEIDVAPYLDNAMIKQGVKLWKSKDPSYTGPTYETPILNINLRPIQPENTVDFNLVPSIYLSVDSGEDEDQDPTQDLINYQKESFSIRLEVTLNDKNGIPNPNDLSTVAPLTTQTTTLINDIYRLFKDSDFVGLGLSQDAYISRARIARWMFDDRVRGGPDEVIIFILQFIVHFPIELI